MSPPLVSILSQMQPVHTLPHYFPKTHLNTISYLCPDLPSGLCSSGFPTKLLYAFLISPMHATCPTHLILYLITLIIPSEACKLWSSHYAVFPSLSPLFPLRSKLCPQYPVLINTLNLCSSHSVRDQVQHAYKTTGKLTVLYILISKCSDRRQNILNRMVASISWI